MGKFSITGDFLTEKIRDLWESKNFKMSVKLGFESLDGSNISHIVSIIDGEMKLTGVNDLDLVTDGEYKPEVSFLDVLDYSMIPNNGYFRIYEQDSRRAYEIIEWFVNTTPDNIGDERRHNLIYEWNTLLPEVREDFKNDIPHWMVVYLRKINGDDEVKRKAGFYSIGIVESEISPVLDRKEFDKICDKYFIYSDREDTWENCIQNRTWITEPSRETLEKNIKDEFGRYKHDITMKSDYGWLSPDGRFTVCDWAAHEVCALAMCEYLKYPFTKEQKQGKQLSDVLLKMGYVKIHRDDIGLFHFTHNRKITPEQEIKIDRYKFAHKMIENEN